MADFEMTLHNPLTDASLDNTNEITFIKESADVVEVVRCKDCKYYDPENKNCMDEMGFARIWEPDDFCSYGERKNR